ncbi:MAG: ComF family protein [Eggerthellaceae bacterium]|nr:ComF family protein [Eggerthellaceae bacterium]
MGEQRLAKAIALLMHEYIEHMRTIDAITFIPNRKRALLKRGFDHMKLIAYALSELMDVPVAQILIANETKDQRLLNRMQRQANAQHMFDATEDISYKHILLIDDVFTTGATLQHGQTCLFEHGAKKVTCLTLMRS